MAEELKDATDIKKLIGKNKGDEEPLIVAQRFLNIFRQLHIFDTQRRDEFNQMILSLPAETRGMFGVLPGGSLLQEYVDELEIRSGLAQSSLMPHQTDADQSETKSASPLSQVKAAAPGGNAKIVADANFAQSIAQAMSSAMQSATGNNKAEMQALIAAIKESKSNGGVASKVYPDETFSRSMAQAFSQALQFSDANKKAEIRELINAVKESKIEFPEDFGKTPPQQVVADEAFAKTLADALGTALEKSSANRNNELKELIAAIKEIKTVEFPENFSIGASGNNTTLAADENFAQGLAQSLTQALEKSENKRNNEMRELVNVIRENKNQEVIKSLSPGEAKNISLTSRVVADQDFAQTLAQSLGDALKTNMPQQKADFREIAEAIKNSKTLDVQAFSDALVSGLEPILLKIGNIQRSSTPEAFAPAQEAVRVSPDHNFADIISNAVSKTMEIAEKSRQEQTDKLIKGFQELLRSQIPLESNIVPTIISGGNPENDTRLEQLTREFTEAINKVTSSHRSEAQEIAEAIKSTQGELVKAITERPVFADRETSLKPSESISDLINTITEAQSNIFQEMSRKQTSELSEIISFAVRESQKSSVQTIVEALKALQKLPPVFVQENDTEDDGGDDSSFDAFLATKKKKKKNKKKKTVLETEEVLGYSASGSEEVYAPLPTTPKIQKSNVEKYIKSEFEPQRLEENQVSSSDWGFSNADYEEDTFSVADETETYADDNGDWEWEYEDSNAEAAEGVEGEDWEWEYESEDGEEYQLADEEGIEGEDWEWEYEEEEEDEAEFAETSLAPTQEVSNDFDTPETVDFAEEDKPVVLESEITDTLPWHAAEPSVEAELLPEEDETTVSEQMVSETKDSALIFDDKAFAVSEISTSTDNTIVLQPETPEISIAELRSTACEPDPYLTDSNIGV